LNGRKGQVDDKSESSRSGTNVDAPNRRMKGNRPQGSLRWSNLGASSKNESDEFLDNHAMYNESIADIYTRLQMIEQEFSNSALNGNHNSLYQAQISSDHSINEIRTQLHAMERRTDEQFQNIRLALQVHKSSTELISDSVMQLYQRTAEVEEELSESGRRISLT
jgi:hypothetical protein